MTDQTSAQRSPQHGYSGSFFFANRFADAHENYFFFISA
jgi:hypothetical protein